jgi:hypothetical protein
MYDIILIHPDGLRHGKDKFFSFSYVRPLLIHGCSEDLHTRAEPSLEPSL